MIQKKIYKNWKELCESMEWKSTGGDYKKARLKDLDSLCKYHKEGNKFIIDEVYKNQLEEKKSRPRAIYQDDISKLVMHECSISENKTEYSIELSVDTLLLKLSMINGNFTALGNNLNQTSRYLRVTIDDLKKYYQKTKNGNKKRLESALDKLQRGSYIKWEKILKINYNGMYRTATNEEVRIIITAERATMNEMEIADKHELYEKGLFRQYNKSVFDKIKDVIKISYYFSVYKIIPSVQFEVAMLDISDKDDVEYKLNTNICNAIERSENDDGDVKKFVDICINRDCSINLYEEVKLLDDKPYTKTDKSIDGLMKRDGADYDLAQYLVEPYITQL